MIRGVMAVSDRYSPPSAPCRTLDLVPARGARTDRPRRARFAKGRLVGRALTGDRPDAKRCTLRKRAGTPEAVGRPAGQPPAGFAFA